MGRENDGDGEGGKKSLGKIQFKDVRSEKQNKSQGGAARRLGRDGALGGGWV